MDFYCMKKITDLLIMAALWIIYLRGSSGEKFELIFKLNCKNEIKIWNNLCIISKRKVLNRVKKYRYPTFFTSNPSRRLKAEKKSFFLTSNSFTRKIKGNNLLLRFYLHSQKRNPLY